jgi:hypothetical protein
MIIINVSKGFQLRRGDYRYPCGIELISANQSCKTRGILDDEILQLWLSCGIIVMRICAHAYDS